MLSINVAPAIDAPQFPGAHLINPRGLYPLILQLYLKTLKQNKKKKFKNEKHLECNASAIKIEKHYQQIKNKQFFKKTHKKNTKMYDNNNNFNILLNKKLPSTVVVYNQRT